MLVRYRVSSTGKLIQREFRRETKYYFHTDRGDRSRKEIWHETAVAALRARVELCDKLAQQSRDRVKFWETEAKEAFVQMVKLMSGRYEYEYDESTGAGATGGPGGGGGEGQGAEAAQAEDDRTGCVG